MALSLEARTRNLIARFADYVLAFGATPAFNDEQLRAHVETLALRAQLGSAQAAAVARSSPGLCAAHSNYGG